MAFPVRNLHLHIDLVFYSSGDAAVHSLTGVGRVAGGSVEEVGRGAQGGHAGVTVAVHARGDGAVAALLRGGAGDITVGGDAARAPTET